jgi:hypothetical protein
VINNLVTRLSSAEELGSFSRVNEKMREQSISIGTDRKVQVEKKTE